MAAPLEWSPQLDCSASSKQLACGANHPDNGSYLQLSLEKSVGPDNGIVSFFGIKYDFEAFGMVPQGWVRSTTRVPDAFLYAGGDACVIEKEVQEQSAEDTLPRRERRVVMALPELAVDLKRAKWLSRRPGFTADAASLCHLKRVKECKATGSVVIEFDYPHGVPLSEILESRKLDEGSVQSLVRSLLKLVTSLGPAPLRLLGFIDSSMIFLNLQDALEAMVPLGCLLSFEGAMSTMFQAIQQHGCDVALAPELKTAMIKKDASVMTALDRACITDTYAIGIIALRALGQQRVDGGKNIIQIELPPLARDLLQKVLHNEPDWRLAGEAALDHPWLRDVRAV